MLDDTNRTTTKPTRNLEVLFEENIKQKPDIIYDYFFGENQKKTFSNTSQECHEKLLKTTRNILRVSLRSPYENNYHLILVWLVFVFLIHVESSFGLSYQAYGLKKFNFFRQSLATSPVISD